MSWVKLDDKFFLNGKTRRASDTARLLYISALCFSAQAESDGVILASDLPVVAAYARILDASAIAAELVRLRLWELTEGGYQIHDYLEYQPSRQSLDAERKRKREWAASNSGASSASNRRSNSVTLATSRSRSGSRTQPDPQKIPAVGAEAPADGRSAPAPAEVSLLDFVTRGKIRTWSFTETTRAELAEAFPDLNIIAEATKAKAWLAANPHRTKTAGGMPKFLYRWVAKSQDGGSRSWGSSAPARDPATGMHDASTSDHSRTGVIPL